MRAAIHEVAAVAAKRRLKQVDPPYSSEDRMEGARVFAENLKPRWRSRTTCLQFAAS